MMPEKWDRMVTWMINAGIILMALAMPGGFVLAIYTGHWYWMLISLVSLIFFAW